MKPGGIIMNTKKIRRNCAILIPTLNPDEKLVEYVQSLYANGFTKIIIINDGSNTVCDSVFLTIQNICTEIDVIQHAINFGKGRGLKNGLNHFLVSPKYAACNGIITVDSDGQHLVEDVIHLDDILTDSYEGIVLGYRDFNGKSVPVKSSFGNKCTRIVFRLLFGTDIIDTQTGLRAFSRKVIKDNLDLEGERFEYETNVLIQSVRNKTEIRQIPITTVYEDNNSGTHFHPIRDSLKIYGLIFAQFFKYIASSLLSFVIDISIFEILFRTLPLEQTKTIWLSTIIARIISSLVNYCFNRKIVFQADNDTVSSSIVKYYLLCVITLCLSGLGVSALNGILGIHEAAAKCIVDSMLFLFNYKIQQVFVFKKEQGDKNER